MVKLKTYMKRKLPYSIMAVALPALMVMATGCEDEDNIDKMGNWVDTEVDFPGTARGSAVCFVINNKAYVGTGANTSKTEEKERYRDFYCCSFIDTISYKCDGTDLPTWSGRWDRTALGVTSMPESAAARNGAVAFSINGKGYVGLGYDGVNYLRDFWEFDPEGTPDPADYPSMADSLKSKFTNTGKWRRIANYPGDSCRFAVSFVIDNVAYVGSGEDYDNNTLNDFYKFDGTNWTQIANIGRARSRATAFTWDGYGYVVGGRLSGVSVDAFQRYNPRTGQWETLNNLKDKTDEQFDDEYTLASYGSTSFIVNSETDKARAYITTGGSSGVAGVSTWEYNPFDDYWIQKTNFERTGLLYAVSFVLRAPDGRDVPFVTTGAIQEIGVTGSGGYFFQGMELFNPYETYERKD